MMSPTAISEVLGGLLCYPTAGVIPSFTGEKSQNPGQDRMTSGTLTAKGTPSCDEASPLEYTAAHMCVPYSTHFTL